MSNENNTSQNNSAEFNESFGSNNGNQDLFKVLDETISPQVISHVVKMTDYQRNKISYTTEQLIELLDKGAIRKSIIDDHVDWPTDAIYQNVDFTRLGKYLQSAKDIDLGHRTKQYHPSFVFTNCALVNCKIPSESVVDAGSIVIGGTTGSGFVARDSLLLGSLKVGNDALILECESQDGVQFGLNNSVISRISYGAAYCSFDHGCSILGGKLKGNTFGSEVRILGSYNYEYNKLLDNFMENVEGKYIKDEFNNRIDPGSRLVYDSGEISHHATLDFSQGLSQANQFPSHESLGGEIFKYVSIRRDNTMVNFENIRVELEDELSAKITESQKVELLDVIQTNREKINQHVFNYLGLLNNTPELDQELTEDIVDKITDKMVVTLTESNSHKDVSNDHKLAVEISDMANKHNFASIRGGKPPKRIMREKVKRMIIDLVVTYPELKSFDVVKSNKYEDPTIRSVFSGDHPFACIMTPEKYKEHKQRIALHDAIERKQQKQNFSADEDMQAIFQQNQVSVFK